MPAASPSRRSATPSPSPSPRPSPSPSPFPGAGPSRYRRQHGARIEPPRVDGTAFKQFWKARTRIDRLIADGAISGAEWTAAIAFRNSFETAFGSIVRSRLGDLGTGRAPPRRAASPAPGERQLAAAARLRDIRHRVGELAYDLLYLCLVEDLAWAEIGRRLQADPKTARAWTVAAVRRLAEIW
jgi:hypothetical protein